MPAGDGVALHNHPAAVSGAPADAHRADGVARLTRSIRRLGLLTLVSMTGYVLLAWGMVRVVPFDATEPLEGAAFERLTEWLGFLGPGAQAFVRGESVLADPVTFAIVYSAPIAIAVIAFLGLLVVLARGAGSIAAGDVNRVLRWAIAFTVVAALAPPVIVQDFWLSTGWGRLAALGRNPYYTFLDPFVTSGLPLDYLGLLTTYGPLWTLVATGVMRVSGTNALLAGVLFKLLLAGLWIGSLLLLRAVLRGRGARAQAVGLALAGWLPLGLIHGVADGHNDVAMAFLMLLWLRLLLRARPLAATAALAGSVVIKYLSAPLFVLDVLYHRAAPAPAAGGGGPAQAPGSHDPTGVGTANRSMGALIRRYIAHAFVAALVGLGATAVFFRDLDFFGSTRHMTNWHFFSPRAAIAALGRLFGIEPATGSLGGLIMIAAAALVSLAFIVPAVRRTLAYGRAPSDDALRAATFAIVAAVLFGLSGHAWPWFMIWGVLAAALNAESWLARWTAGMAIAMCFVMVPVVAWSVDAPGPLSLVLCAFALAFAVLAPARWFGAVPARVR